MTATVQKPRSFQEIILRLQTYWASKGCAVLLITYWPALSLALVR